MRCSRSARGGSAVRTAAILGLVLPWLAAATAVEAQSSRRRAGDEAPGSEASDHMKMPSTSIEGERQTPDIFFVFPTGKGGNLSMPHVRDYGPDILEPVVKPWFEREQALGPSQIQEVVTTRSSDWKEALKSSPPPPAPPAEPPPPRPAVAPPAIPGQALSMPSSAVSAPANPPSAPATPPTAESLPRAAAPPSAPSSPASREMGPPGYRPPSPDQLRAIGQ